MSAPQILVVDDNRELADNLAELLEDAEYAVTVAYDGPSAIAAAKRQRFDAVLTDIRMPGMDGVELIRELQAMNLATNYFLMTAYASDVVLAEAVRSGVQAILNKPFELGLLLQSLPRSATKVLLVEGHPLAEVMSEALHRRGFRTTAAALPVDARRSLDEAPPDAAVVDLDLGDVECAELTRDLVARAIPVVMVGSGATTRELPEFARALPTRAYRFLVKPFDTEALLVSLRSLLRAQQGAA
ncbi:MAG: response regulator [Nannocystaceae bacterium]